MAQTKVDVTLPSQSTSTVVSKSSTEKANITLQTASSTVSTPVGAEVCLVMVGHGGPPGPVAPFIVFETGVQTISGHKTFMSGITIVDSFAVAGASDLQGTLGISGEVKSPFIKSQSIKHSIIFGS